MSLYNMLCGINPASIRLLESINILYSDIPRFRDVWIDKEFKKIFIRARIGGVNREDYHDEIEKIKQHTLYIHDYDDSNDDTYAEFLFKFPDYEGDKLKKEIEEFCNNDHDKIEFVIKEITETASEKLLKAMKKFEESK